MIEIGLSLIYAVLLWWGSTGAILYLDNLPRHTFRWSLIGITVLLGLALIGLYWSRDDGSVFGAYAAFTYGLLVWAWIETTFLLGAITGPRRQPCPQNCGAWPRFRNAVAVILYHEIAIILAVGAVALITWQGANQVGLWTLLVLWAMRTSAKLNLHFGVPNVNEGFLPPHLAYLGSYLRQRPMNLLFPFVVTAGTVVCVLLSEAAATAEAGSAARVGLILVMSLLGLAVLEHWFMVIPMDPAFLWHWGMRLRPDQNAAADGKGQDSNHHPAAPLRVIPSLGSKAPGAHTPLQTSWRRS